MIRPVPARQPSTRCGRYWICLSLRFTARVIWPGRLRRGCRGRADQRPDALLRVQIRCVGGQLEYREPVSVRFDELAQRCGQVDPDVVPDEHDGTAELGAGSDEQVAEVAPAEALRLVLASFVLADRVDQPGPRPWFVAGHACHRHPAGASTSDTYQRGPADSAPGSCARRHQRLPGFVLEDDPGTASRRGAPTRDQTSFFHSSSSRSTARRVGCCHDQPCRRSPRALHRVGDVEESADQRLHPRQRPPLIRPAVN